MKRDYRQYVWFILWMLAISADVALGADDCFDKTRQCFYYGKSECADYDKYGEKNHTFDGSECKKGKSCQSINPKRRGPWCYKAKPAWSWDYCFPDCSPVADHCYNSERQCFHYEKRECKQHVYRYRGKHNRTIDGSACLKWSRGPESFSALEGNYCTNPDNSDGPWCYYLTGHGAIAWDYCFPHCAGECYDAGRNCFHYENMFECWESEDYPRRVTHTKSGLKCKKWSDAAPNLSRRKPYPENYCRTGRMDALGPVCYTNVDGEKKLENCFLGCSEVTTTTVATHCFDDTLGCFRYGNGECLGPTAYSGTRSKTRSGTECLMWSGYSSDPNLPNNYCRNPDGGDGPWCLTKYTENNNWEWDYCFPACVAHCFNDALGCFRYGNGECSGTTAYSGTRSKTLDGTECLMWSGYSPDPDLPNNYCRNPDGGDGPWCLTKYTGNNWEWGYCFPTCVEDCFNDVRGCFRYKDAGCLGVNAYNGTRSVTRTGIKCHVWGESSGLPSNYCRNPEDGDGPWCYTKDLGNGLWDWEYCIPDCAEDTK